MSKKSHSLSEEPRVGIFWSYERKLFHVESSPQSKGIKTSISIDYPISHYTAWFIMNKKGILESLPPYLREEYDSISRGRVVYLLEKKLYVIYHGDDFNAVQRRRLIRTLFLPEAQTHNEIDEHYNPLPDDFVF